MTVVVEPDDAAAWIGLLGVVVGAALTGGFEWWRTVRGERRHRRRELVVAGWELERRAELLVLTKQLWSRSRRPTPAWEQRPDPDLAVSAAHLEWMRLITERPDKLYEVGDLIVSAGSPELALAAQKVMEEAHRFARRDWSNLAHAELDEAVLAFKAELEKVRP